MKRSIIMTGLMGLLLAGQSVQAANKISSVRVGFLQKEYKTANPERQAQILEQLNTGGYPAIATQLQKGAPAKPALTKEKPVEEQIKEIKKEQQELPAVKQEVNKELADAAKAERALAEQQTKEREVEAKRIKALEAEKQRLEQLGKGEEAAKKNEELAAAKEKLLQDELRREEEIKNAAAEQQRLKDEQEALKKREEMLRKEALAREASEKNLVAILTAGNAKLPEFKRQLENAKTVNEFDTLIANMNQFWGKIIRKMPGFSENENDKAVTDLNSELHTIQKAAEAKRDEIRKAAGKEKEEEKTIPPTPTQKPGEAGEKSFKEKQKELEEKLGSGKKPEAKLSAASDPQVRLDTLLESAKVSAGLKEEDQQKNQYLAVKKEIARINGIVEVNAMRFYNKNKNNPQKTFRTSDEDQSDYVLIEESFFALPNSKESSYNYYQLLNDKQNKLYNTVGKFKVFGGGADTQPIYNLNERYYTSGPKKTNSIAKVQ